MTVAVLIGAIIAAGSVWGAAYLLSLWHEDARSLRRVSWRTWPFSRVLAYVSIACTLASNYLIVPSALRLLSVEGFHDIVAALTPFTIIAIIVLDVAFVVIAIYLRVIRKRRGR